MKSAAYYEQKKDESWERSGTDGFVSQHCHGLNAQLAGAQEKIKENGGKATFSGLFYRATGERVAAKLIKGKFGYCWMFVDGDGKSTGQFLGDSRTKRAKLWKEGFEVRDEEAEAAASFGGNGTGLSGLATVFINVYRKDGGYPENSRVFG